MPLDATQTREVVRAFADEVFVRGRRTATVDTDAIEAATDGLVTFIEANAAPINNALPEPFKSVATIEEKRKLVGLVAAKLAGI